MAKNIDQVFMNNPITTNAGTDLMYFGQSPYGAGNDAAMLFSNFKAQFSPAGAVTNFQTDSGIATPTSGTINLLGNLTGLTFTSLVSTINLGGTLNPTSGGTGASLVPSNGGIVYSGSTSLAILAGTATAGLPLLSGLSTAPTWGTFALSLGGAFTTAGALTTSGAFSTTFTFTNTTSVTFPTSGTLATTSQLPTLPLSLANGGTNANLTASNGGIFYSTGSAGAILAGTVTAGQILISGASTTPSWLAAGGGGTLVRSVGTAWAASTTTLANSFSINTIVYAASANNLSGLATANSSILTTNGTGVPSWATSLPSGIAPFTTVDQASASVTLAVNTQYITDNGASLVTYTLPATAAQGSIFRIVGSSSGGWKIAQASGQTCHVGSSATTAGVGGSIASTNQWDTIELVCTTANTTFATTAMQGNLTIV